MRDVGDLYSLACSENVENWQMNIKPNIPTRHCQHLERGGILAQ